MTSTPRFPPLPSTVSTPAREALQNFPSAAGPDDLEIHRGMCARVQRELGATQLARHGVRMEERTVGTVPARVFSPSPEVLNRREDRVLLNLHGGGFIVDAGSITENAPIAGYAGITVVAARYRLAPENPYPAAVDDAEAVYRSLLNQYEPRQIGLYGTSAGACLSAQLLVRLRDTGAPLPGVFGFFSGTADLSRSGDSESFFRPQEELTSAPFPHYVGAAERLSPQVSPIFSDLCEFPPTLCIAGTRDFMLSQTALFHRALQRSGVDARLLVFEAMPHAHWIFLDLPESDEAFRAMASFFSTHLC
jgi:epsilon-lactone hydrolase